MLFLAQYTTFFVFRFSFPRPLSGNIVVFFVAFRSTTRHSDNKNADFSCFWIDNPVFISYTECNTYTFYTSLHTTFSIHIIQV